MDPLAMKESIARILWGQGGYDKQTPSAETPAMGPPNFKGTLIPALSELLGYLQPRRGLPRTGDRGGPQGPPLSHLSCHTDPGRGARPPAPHTGHGQSQALTSSRPIATHTGGFFGAADALQTMRKSMRPHA